MWWLFLWTILIHLFDIHAHNGPNEANNNDDFRDYDQPHIDGIMGIDGRCPIKRIVSKQVG